MSKLVISHRGNISGPKSCEENTHETILHAMALGYDVEIDLWRSENQLFLGHDGPEHETTYTFLSSYYHRLWIHCKNLEALEWCIRKGLRCFSHDKDDAVLVSDKSIWRYPTYNLYVGEDTIIVLPEKCFTDDNQYNKCRGFCTDYPLIYSYFSPSKHSYLLDLEKTYNTIHRREFVQSYDSLLRNENDRRRCLAIFSYLPLNDIVSWTISQLKGLIPDNVFYDSDARLHVTLTQVVPFSEYLDKEYHPIIEIPKEEEYIVFSGLLLLPGSIALRGYPSFDINEKRKKIGGSYKNDICHSTIVRFSRELTAEEKEKVKGFVNEHRDTFYGRYDIKSWELAKCSWKMNESEITRL